MAHETFPKTRAAIAHYRAVRHDYNAGRQAMRAVCDAFEEECELPLPGGWDEGSVSYIEWLIRYGSRAAISIDSL